MRNAQKYILMSLRCPISRPKVIPKECIALLLAEAWKHSYWFQARLKAV
jgi:hypothetical protein